MRTTITLDDELLDSAREYSGLTETSAIVRAAMIAFVQHQAALRLARLGGTEPDIQLVRRRRFDPE